MSRSGTRSVIPAVYPNWPTVAVADAMPLPTCSAAAIAVSSG
jgi:hypothetical protein